VSEGSGSDLAAVLEYLRGIGWEEMYAAQVMVAGAVEERSRSGGREQAPPRHPEASGSRGGWAAVRASLAQSVAPAGGPAAITGEDAGPRAASLAAVAAEALACTRCKLAGGRKTVVFGTGDANADLMFIGEGPGAEEDRQGLPFVGAAGQLLDRIIAAIGFARPQVYICNVVKCRPPGNRDPQPDEVAACRGFLESQVRLVQPKVIVALGRVAAQTLLGSDQPVGRMRGHWHQVFGVPLRVTYHPAAILRDGSYRRPTWDDMQLVRDRLLAASSG